MANCLFSWPVWSDLGLVTNPSFISGVGSWLSALPLANLQDPKLSLVARSTDATLANTQFAMNLGTSRSVGLVAFPLHTLSTAAKVRVRLTNANAAATSFIRWLDFSTGFSSVGTPTRVAANHVNSLDNVPLDLIGDDAGAALEGYTRSYGAVTASGNQAIFAFRIAAGGTSTALVIRIRDTTASADRLLLVIDPTAGSPSPTMTTGTQVSVTPIGNQFRVAVKTSTLTAGNTLQLEVYPASNAALSTTQTGTANVGDFELHDFNSDRLVYDSGLALAYPAGTTADDLRGMVCVAFCLAFTPVTAQEVWVEFYDTGNAAGYIDVARVVIAGAYQPAVNFSYGAGLQWEDLTRRSDSESGAPLFNRRPRRRSVAAQLEEMPESEALLTWFQMQQVLGISGQVFFMWDSADTTYKHRRSFLANFRAPSAIEHPYLQRYRNAFQLLEVLP